MRKATTLSLDQDLLKEAKSFGLNISQAAETGLRKAVLDMKAQQWKRKNTKALESSNDWVEKNGLPLEKYRSF